MSGYLGFQGNYYGDLDPYYAGAQKSGGGGMDFGSAAGAGASGFAAGGPVGAAIGVGGSFLSQYLNQRHQEEQARKAAELSAAKYEGDSKSNALSEMLNAWRSALR